MSSQTGRQLVSVIVPTYNRAYCLARTLDSALAQTYRDIEIVVVDDGSTDDTEQLVATRYADEPRVRYLKQENRGVTGARNTGLRASTGDCVALLDSDDIWKPWKIELQMHALARVPDAGMVWTDMEAVDPDGRVTSGRYLRQMYSAYRWFPTPDDLFARSYPVKEWSGLEIPELRSARLYVGEIYSQMILGNLVHTSTVLLTRERLERVGGFNEALKLSGEDYDFHLRTCREGPVAFIDAASMQYQRGMADRLTRPEYGIHVARNFLFTVEQALAHDPDRITLPKHMLNHVRAEANEWVGGVHFYNNDRVDARRYLLASLRYRPLQPRVWGMALACLLPQALSKLMLQAWRTIRRH